MKWKIAASPTRGQSSERHSSKPAAAARGKLKSVTRLALHDKARVHGVSHCLRSAGGGRASCPSEDTLNRSNRRWFKDTAGFEPGRRGSGNPASPRLVVAARGPSSGRE